MRFHWTRDLDKVDLGVEHGIQVRDGLGTEGQPGSIIGVQCQVFVSGWLILRRKLRALCQRSAFTSKILFELSPALVEPHGKDILGWSQSPQEVRAESVLLVQDSKGEKCGEYLPDNYV